MREKRLSARKVENRANNTPKPEAGASFEGSTWQKVNALVSYTSGTHTKDVVRMKTSLTSLNASAAWGRADFFRKPWLYGHIIMVQLDSMLSKTRCKLTGHRRLYGGRFVSFIAVKSLPPQYEDSPTRLMTFMNQPDIYGVAYFVAECLALFPWFFLASFWFGFRLFPSFRSDAPRRHIQRCNLTLPYTQLGTCKYKSRYKPSEQPAFLE